MTKNTKTNGSLNRNLQLGGGLASPCRKREGHTPSHSATHFQFFEEKDEPLSVGESVETALSALAAIF